MDIYVLIGKQHAGKSSLTRCLSGCRVNGKRLIAIGSRDVEVYVKLSSLQEKKISAAQFVSEVDRSCKAVLVSLRPRARRGDADDYLREFSRQKGWKVLHVACLGVPASTVSITLPGASIHELETVSETMPINRLAAEVRDRFGWT